MKHLKNTKEYDKIISRISSDYNGGAESSTHMMMLMGSQITRLTRSGQVPISTIIDGHTANLTTAIHSVQLLRKPIRYLQILYSALLDTQALMPDAKFIWTHRYVKSGNYRLECTVDFSSVPKTPHTLNEN